MFARPTLLISILQVALLLSSVEARTWLLERDGRAIYGRKFGQDQPAVLQELAAACGGGVCNTLASEAVSHLTSYLIYFSLGFLPSVFDIVSWTIEDLRVANMRFRVLRSLHYWLPSPSVRNRTWLIRLSVCSFPLHFICDREGLRDFTDASSQFDAATQAKMIAVAVKYRQTEKNTPPDSSTNPPKLRNSVYCQKAPKNGQLNGLVQAQDPANDPNLFFDPATGATIIRGSQPNTSPLGTIADFAKVPTLDGQVRFVSRNAKNGTTSDNSGDSGADDNSSDKKGGGKKNGGKNDGSDKKDGGNKKDGNKKDGNKKNGDKGGNKKDDGNKGGNKKDDGKKDGNKKDGSKKDGGKKDGSKKDGSKNDGNNQNGGQKQGDLKNNADGDVSNMSVLTPMHGGNNKTSDGVTKSNIVSSNGGKNGTDVNNGMNSKNGTVSAGNIGNFGSCSVPQIKFGAGFDGRRETAFEPVDQGKQNRFPLFLSFRRTLR
jgi:hypothetical protein